MTSRRLLASLTLVGAATLGCVSIDKSPSGKPGTGESTPHQAATLSERQAVRTEPAIPPLPSSAVQLTAYRSANPTDAQESVANSQPQSSNAAVDRLPAVNETERLLQAEQGENEAEQRRPRSLVPPVPTEFAVEEASHDLDLSSALTIAGGQNPRIAFAAARYREAYARYAAAKTLWLPSLRAGASFNHHDGPLQATPGEVLKVSRSSLQAGAGTRAVGAGTPMVPGLVADFHMTDAFFQPKIASHVVSARRAARRTATNDTLLATALSYLELLRTIQELRIAEQTRDDARQLSALTKSFADAGQGPQADADRVQTELFLRRNEVSRAEESVAVASARLAELLRLDASIPVAPLETMVVPIDLVPLDIPHSELVTTGLMNRPELAEAQHLVCEAVYRYRREKYAPLTPSVLLGISQSGFGGGLGSNVGTMRGRFDLDASAHWEIRNLGFGEHAQRDATRSQYDQARFLQAQTLDRVAREIVEARAQVESRSGQITVAQSGITAANDSYQRDLERIREGQGLPIEVLQSLRALDEIRRDYLRAVTGYNEAQFRLQRALGWPIRMASSQS